MRLIPILLLLVLVVGCTSLDELRNKSVRVQANAAIMRVNPATSSLELGYGSISSSTIPTKAGQKATITSCQYAANSSNAWYTETITVEAAVDGTASVTTGPRPLIQLFGLTIYAPWTPAITTIQTTPAIPTNFMSHTFNQEHQ